MTGLKTREARRRKTGVLPWRGKVQPGDVVEYRLRVTDNLPPEFGGPHVVYYPADHALTLRIATDKEIVALMDDIYARLDKIKEDLKAEERGVYKTRTDSRDHAALTPAQANEAKELKKDNKIRKTNYRNWPRRRRRRRCSGRWPTSPGRGRQGDEGERKGAGQGRRRPQDRRRTRRPFPELRKAARFGPVASGRDAEEKRGVGPGGAGRVEPGEAGRQGKGAGGPGRRAWPPKTR